MVLAEDAEIVGEELAQHGDGVAGAAGFEVGGGEVVACGQGAGVLVSVYAFDVWEELGEFGDGGDIVTLEDAIGGGLVLEVEHGLRSVIGGEFARERVDVR